MVGKLGAVLFTLLGASHLLSCQSRCQQSLDCAAGSHCTEAGRCTAECYTDIDCLSPPECRDNAAACPPRGSRCSSDGRCMGDVPRENEAPQPVPMTEPEPTCWGDPIGFSPSFVFDSLSIAGEGLGFDLDGLCRGPGDCVDNALWKLGDVANSQLRQGLSGGETIILSEMVCVEEPFRGTDSSVTVRFYSGSDADDPINPANNFSVPEGDVDCCEFKISRESIFGIPAQARARVLASITAGRLASRVPIPVEFVLTIGDPPFTRIRLENALISARVDSELTRMSEGLLGGAITARNLAEIDNPYCKTLNQLCPRLNPESTMIDLVASFLQPDVDLDVPKNGLDRIELGSNGRVARCFNGRGEVVAPQFSGEPESCVFGLTDGFSVSFAFTAVQAQIVGVSD